MLCHGRHQKDKLEQPIAAHAIAARTQPAQLDGELANVYILKGGREPDVRGVEHLVVFHAVVVRGQHNHIEHDDAIHEVLEAVRHGDAVRPEPQGAQQARRARPPRGGDRANATDECYPLPLSGRH